MVLLSSKENSRHEEMSSQNDSALVQHVDIYAIRAPVVRSGEGVGKPQRVQVAWQMPDWQGRGMAGHAS